MRLGELLEGIEIITSNVSGDTLIGNICMDSRNVKDGSLFVAIPGYSTDGHLFIPNAVRAGACAVLSERELDGSIPHVVVRSTRAAISLIASTFYGHPSKAMKMIAVTGTNGKTTTTYLIKAIIENSLGIKAGLIGTNRNMIGDSEIPAERTTPDALSLHALLAEMRKAGCECCVMEASSHALDQGRVDSILFDVGVFTNLSQDHLDYHKTMEAYTAVKAKLFEQSKISVINLDDGTSGYMTDHVTGKLVLYSVDRLEADVNAKNIRLKPDRVEFDVLTRDELVRVDLGIPGSFSVYNALAALACGYALGIPMATAASALKDAAGVSGRIEVVPTGRDFTVIIDYAHTPDALKNILSTVREFTKGRVIALFGCGGDRDTRKRPVMGAVAAELADLVVVTSDNPRTENPISIIEQIMDGMKGRKVARKVIENREKAIHWAIQNVRPGDLIVLAGKGHENYQEIDGEKRHMDEREIVAAALKKLNN